MAPAFGVHCLDSSSESRPVDSLAIRWSSLVARFAGVAVVAAARMSAGHQKLGEDSLFTC